MMRFRSKTTTDNPSTIHTNCDYQHIEAAMTESGSLSKDQERIIMELEMILTTVKQIDANLRRSIDVLDSTDSTNGNYRELVVLNAGRIREILELLGSSGSGIAREEA